jgi:hypothetical protein
MTSPSDNPEKVTLINFERMNREVVCLNPTHPTITLNTTETQPKCPICDNVMVTVIKSALTGEIVNTPREE